MAEVTTLSFDYSISDLLAGKIDVSDPYQNYNSRGNPTSFGVDLDFHEMHLSKTLKSSEFYVLRGKIEDTLRTWETKYQRHIDKVHKENRAEHVDELKVIKLGFFLPLKNSTGFIRKASLRLMESQSTVSSTLNV